jgi:CheY-like chemotaxis protein
MLGGNIWCESEFGKGSVFYFDLPYNSYFESKPVIDHNGTSKTENRKTENLVILIVEDDAPSEMLLTGLVRPYARKILRVTNGSDAVEACRNNPDINLILMDIRLSGIDGYETTRRIRETDKNVVIIAQTAFGLIGEKEKALAAGCTDYISKPVDMNVLFELLKKYFGQHH